MQLLVSTSKGIYCPAGDFYIDPLRPVERALITHAHSDHARAGSQAYLTAEQGLHVLRARLGKSAVIEGIGYGEKRTIGGVTVSFHPAGHVLGSAQLKIVAKGEVWVVSGDYKTKPDLSCQAFELVPCHVFLTESTFALPIFRWPDPELVARQMNSWWQENRKQGIASLIYAYSFGKAQRLLTLLDDSIGRIYVHKKIQEMNRQYEASGVSLPKCLTLPDLNKSSDLINAKTFAGEMILLPPGALESNHLSNPQFYATAMASGWAKIRKMQNAGAVEKGFVLSDHADWDELVHVTKSCGAEQILLRHGYVKPFQRYLIEQGINAKTFHLPRSSDFDLASDGERSY